MLCAIAAGVLQRRSACRRSCAACGKAAPGCRLHNLYGPTEAAVDVSWHPAWGEALAAVTGANVPIGLPVWNTGLRILDARLRPVPPGVAGICISPAYSWRTAIWGDPN